MERFHVPGIEVVLKSWLEDMGDVVPSTLLLSEGDRWVSVAADVLIGGIAVMSTRCVTSLLQQDMYKVSMSDMILGAGHQDVQVRYELINRSSAKYRLHEHVDVDEFREQLAAIRGTKFQTDELRYLHSLGHIGDELLHYLSLYLDLPEPDIWVDGDGELRVTIEGRWIDSIWWEIPVLATANELYFRGLMKSQGLDSAIAMKQIFDAGEERLRAKVEAMAKIPQASVMEFGTRRRFSGPWQRHILEMMLDLMPHQVSGTSNVALAREFNLKPMGTMAHELFLAYMGIYGATDEGMWNSQRYVLRDWWNRFRGPLSIALTDTVGTDAFLRIFTEEQARSWWGVRQDSGDPFRFGRSMIDFYRAKGIDPRRKMIVFSDGLDAGLITGLWDVFSELVGMGFGWGTNLMNDLGFDTLSLVMKLVAANGVPVAKLSDNPAKATGDKVAISRAMATFCPRQDAAEECRY